MYVDLHTRTYLFAAWPNDSFPAAPARLARPKAANLLLPLVWHKFKHNSVYCFTLLSFSPPSPAASRFAAWQRRCSRCSRGCSPCKPQRRVRAAAGLGSRCSDTVGLEGGDGVDDDAVVVRETKGVGKLLVDLIVGKVLLRRAETLLASGMGNLSRQQTYTQSQVNQHWKGLCSWLILLY